MKQLPRNTVRNTFIFLGVPLVSLSASFILLYLLVPVRYSSAPVELVGTPDIPLTRDALKKTSIGSPVRVEIKSIDVSAVVNPVGLTSDGDMAISSNTEEVAWYEPGQKPGEEGSAVLAGHYGWKDGIPSVFNNLHTLSAGDLISTYDSDGNASTFAVRSIRRYDPEADATYVFRSDDGKAHLNLVTCQGAWNNSAQTYSERLVVFTDLVE